MSLRPVGLAIYRDGNLPLMAETVRQWQRFFDSHAERYDENPFTTNTVAEVDFFLKLYAIAPGSSILDVGCGTGRHAIELARRGFAVTGIDLSQAMLSVARKKADLEGLAVEFVQADARSFDLVRVFDAAICLCEGGFGLIEHGENAEVEDQAILDRIAAHLVPGSPFLLTALNGYSIIRQMKDEHVSAGQFDPATMQAMYQDEMNIPGGPVVVNIHERLFIPPEVVRMLKIAGFRVHHVFGGTAGQWGQRPVLLDEIEVMYVAQKQ
jgi:2-polyprenyl-3-methyl-5-hydroxy-6-metoxy-1,4-benzoquinol methylase